MTNTVHVKIVGIEDLRAKFAELGKAISGQHLAQAALAGAMQVETFAKLSMGADKHGRMYGTHRASAPGEAPAIDLGLLVNSIKSEIQETHETAASAAAGVDGAEYGEPLEYGTEHILPRPFMRPAIDEHEKEVEQAVRTVLEHLVMGAAGNG